MKPVITSNDTSINIKYIDDEESHYQLNIPNNDINKKLIENTVFKFEKSGTQTIIMHDDNNVFHLSKMECKYSEFIEMKKQLENTEKEVILLKQVLSKNEKEMVNFKNDLLQQIKNNMVDFKNELFDTNNSLQKQIEKVNDKSIEYKKDIDTLNSKLYNTDNLLQHQIKILKDKHKKEIDNLKNELNENKKQIDIINSKLNNDLQQQIKLFNDKLVEDKKDLQQQIKLSIHQFNKDINLPFVFIMHSSSHESTRTYYHTNKNELIYHDSRNCCYLPEFIPYIFSQQDVKLLTYGSENGGFRTCGCQTQYLYERIIIPPGKVFISINLSTTIKIYNKGIHDNIKTDDVIMLINEKDISNILAIWKKEERTKDIIITQIESTCLKE